MHPCDWSAENRHGALGTGHAGRRVHAEPALGPAEAPEGEPEHRRRHLLPVRLRRPARARLRGTAGRRIRLRVAGPQSALRALRDARRHHPDHRHRAARAPVLASQLRGRDHLLQDRDGAGRGIRRRDPRRAGEPRRRVRDRHQPRRGDVHLGREDPPHLRQPAPRLDRPRRLHRGAVGHVLRPERSRLPRRLALPRRRGVPDAGRVHARLRAGVPDRGDGGVDPAA